VKAKFYGIYNFILGAGGAKKLVRNSWRGIRSGSYSGK
ncbi:MAG: hypothetical protein ACI9HK_005998, partial [Pirellulaceae bacterium]